MNNDFMNNIKNCMNSFAESEKQMHETMCNPDTSKIQSSIDSRRRMDKEDRLVELELLNENLIKKLKLQNKSSGIKAIIYGALGCIIGGVFMYYFPLILKWLGIP